MTPEQSLRAGVDQLRPILEPHGFRYVPGDAGESSGGPFAAGRFAKEGRALEFSVRAGLGQVVYELGKDRISHEDFLRFSGHWGHHAYPGFGQTVEASFGALARDLESFFLDFIAGDGKAFAEVIAARRADPDRFKGFAALGRT
jgi:hypothetical protein